MKVFLFTLLVLATSISGFAQYTARLDEHASVVLPSKPQQMDGLISQIQYKHSTKKTGLPLWPQP